MKIVAATNNLNKVREFGEVLNDLGITVLSLKDLGINIEIEETGTTFYENAKLKAEAIKNLCDLPVLADDSGLCVEALDGAPGLYSARFGGEDLDDAGKRVLMLEKMKNEKNRKAYFISSLVMLFPDGEEITAEEKVFGEIMTEECGTAGFGYDPIFFCNEINMGFGVATPEQKDAVSHRGKALRSLYKKLEKRGK